MATAEFFICKYSELKAAGTITKFYEDLRDEVISFIDPEGKIVSFSSVCPHLGGEIVTGNSPGTLKCRWHGLQFNEQGHAINCKTRLSLRKYESIIRDEGVYLKYEL